MATPFDRYPYTNFHELNLAYFITHFREIFAQWDQLYTDMLSWKDATDEELAEWKAGVLSDIDAWETVLNASLDAWKADTESDITGWMNDVIDALDAWKAAFQTLFDTTFSNLEDIKTDAEDARDAAIAAQTAAEASAASVAASAAQISTNAADISDLQSSVNAINQNIGLSNIELLVVGNGQINNSGVIKATSAYNLSYFAMEQDAHYLVFNTVRFGYFDNTPVVDLAAIDTTFHTGSNVDGVSGTVYVVLQSLTGVTPVVLQIPYTQSLSEKMAAITTQSTVPASGILTEGAFFHTNGTETASNSWKYYKYASAPGDVFSVTTTAGQTAKTWLVLDSNGTPIGWSSFSGSPEERTEITAIPSNGKYLVVNCQASADVTVTKTSIIVKVDKPIDIMFGKIFCAVGDSITYGDDMDAEGFVDDPNITFFQWHGDYHSQADGTWDAQSTNIRKTWNYLIAKRHGMTLYNGGVNGSTMEGLDDKYGFSLANGRYTKLPDNIDYLVIWFGWNDAAYGTLGTINDNTNESFYGGYNVVLPYLINKYPYTKIGIIVPYGTDANHREAVRLLGNKWGVAVWDNYQGGTPLYYGKEDSVGVESSIVTSNRTKFQAAGAHPNHYGHEALSTMIEQWMLSL